MKHCTKLYFKGINDLHAVSQEIHYYKYSRSTDINTKVSKKKNGGAQKYSLIWTGTHKTYQHDNVEAKIYLNLFSSRNYLTSPCHHGIVEANIRKGQIPCLGLLTARQGKVLRSRWLQPKVIIPPLLGHLAHKTDQTPSQCYWLLKIQQEKQISSVQLC